MHCFCFKKEDEEAGLSSAGNVHAILHARRCFAMTNFNHIFTWQKDLHNLRNGIQQVQIESHHNSWADDFSIVYTEEILWTFP